MEKIFIIFFCFFLIFLFLNNLFSKNNFQNTSDTEQINHIKIYYFNASWCFHCQNFKPIWNNFVDSLHDTDNITPINLNCDNNKENVDLINKYNIEGFPTIIIVYNDNKFVKYSGPKTVNGLRKFLKLDNNSDTRLSVYNFNTNTCGYSVRFQPIWNQFINSNNDPKIKIYDVKCDDPKNNNLCNKFEIEGYPTVIKENHLTNKIVYYNGPRTLDGLMNFIK
jgi:thiol-disulfide isomerase/thioredoxin